MTFNPCLVALTSGCNWFSHCCNCLWNWLLWYSLSNWKCRVALYKPITGTRSATAPYTVNKIVNFIFPKRRLWNLAPQLSNMSFRKELMDIHGCYSPVSWLIATYSPFTCTHFLDGNRNYSNPSWKVQFSMMTLMKQLCLSAGYFWNQRRNLKTKKI